MGNEWNHAQVDGANIRHLKYELWLGRLNAIIDGFFRNIGFSSRSCLGSLLLSLARRDLVEFVPVVRMVWVHGVQERELGVIALPFPDLVLKLLWVCRISNKGSRLVDYGWETRVNILHSLQSIASELTFYLRRRQNQTGGETQARLCAVTHVDVDVAVHVGPVEHLSHGGDGRTGRAATPRLYARAFPTAKYLRESALARRLPQRPRCSGHSDQRAPILVDCSGTFSYYSLVLL